VELVEQLGRQAPPRLDYDQRHAISDKNGAALVACLVKKLEHAIADDVWESGGREPMHAPVIIENKRPRGLFGGGGLNRNDRRLDLSPCDICDICDIARK
jgi:hypothetical protein